MYVCHVYTGVKACKQTLVRACQNASTHATRVPTHVFTCI